MLMDVVAVLIVVVFWAIVFVFAFWFSRRALKAPIEYEEVEAPETSEPEAVAGEGQATAVNDRVPSGSGH